MVTFGRQWRVGDLYLQIAEADEGITGYWRSYA
jgi:hypothetical protein